MASKEVILLLQSLLEDHSIAYSEIKFIAVNQGPGAFTTLRVVISTVNGLCFATQVPLIGINALHALLDEYPYQGPSIALLNAFSQDLYYGIKIPNNTDSIQGCAKIGHIFNEYALKDTSILFLGNGAEIHKEAIANFCGKRANFLDPMPQTCSITHIGLLGLQQWQQQENLSFQLQPIYLKQASF